ncbi:MFS transporter [Streptomyces albus subsp. chlorinus]|uniref:MFS transporter n=1 Tax=Streptomyces albus TaxID=1888 RepID=UPI00156F3DDB|nr:MFS transporter [Streptomyces albus]NSC25531.1 MFS transporter [Streptomyces albus subsp. chlorinus]
MAAKATWTRSELALLWLLCSAQFVLIVDVVVVNIAVPSIRSELDVPVSFLQLTSVAYTVAFGSLLIVAGRAGDLFGRRKVLITGLVVFTAMSLVCGLSQEGWQLFAARAGQGVGAAMISPNAMALLVSGFREGELRNRALGIWAAVGSAGAIAGQLLGGVVTEYIGWRGIFLINVPIGVLVGVAAVRLLPDGTGPRRSPNEPAERLDVPGAILLAVTLGGASVLLADISGGESWLLVTGLLVLALLALALVMTERRSVDPVLPGALLARRNVAVANLVLMLNASATTSALYFTTLTMQTEMGYGALQTGLGFAPVTAVVLAISPKAGALVQRLGARKLLLVGSCVSAVGLLVLVFTATSNGNYWSGILPGLILVAAGNGLSYAPTFSLATTVPEKEHGRASGLINTAQELGSASGLAVLASIAALGALGGLGDFSLGYLAAACAALCAGLLTFAAPKPEPAPETGQDTTEPLAARKGEATEEM